MSPKFQKRSELKFVGRIIPRAKLRGTCTFCYNSSGDAILPNTAEAAATAGLAR
jgi:hypothetical protein